MNYKCLIALIVNLAFMASITIAQETVESLMKKTVDFNAPIISSEDVLINLKQLKDMVPKDNSPVQFDLENLISFSVMRPEKCTTKFDEQNQWLREPNNVSSPNKDKLWGPNIMAYFTHFKVKSFEYCIEELKKNVQQVSGDDLNKVKQISKLIQPNGVQSVNDLDTIEVREIFDGVSKYLKDTDKNFDKDMQKAKTREDAHKRYEKDLPVVCKRVIKNIKPTQFVFKAKNEVDFPPNLFNNQFLADWMFNYRICNSIVSHQTDEFDSYYFGDKGIPIEKAPWYKVVASGGFYGGSSGGSGSSFVSSCAVASM